jgi:hypothetical protein
MFRLGLNKPGVKHAYWVEPGHPLREIEFQALQPGGGQGNGDGLPVTLRLPPQSATTFYPPYAGSPTNPAADDRDNEILFFPRGGLQVDMADCFPQFVYDSKRPGTTGGKASARSRLSFGLGGRDVRDRWDDPGSWGPSAMGWRLLGGVLRRFECDVFSATPRPINHLLIATATRHSGAGAPASAHILSRYISYPGWGTDTPILAGENMGDLPYGVILTIRDVDLALRDLLGLSPFGKVLFGTIAGFGICLADGQGQTVDGGGVVQMRVDSGWVPGSPEHAAVDADLIKLLPLLYPVFNPRSHVGGDAPEIWTDGMPYVGGGGRRLAGSINTAWDA